MTTPISTIPWNSLQIKHRLDRAVHNLKAEHPPGSKTQNARLKAACVELESLFVYYLFKEMRATVPKDGLINGGKAEAIYTSMMDMEMAKTLSRKGIGLSEAILRQLAGRTGPGEEQQ